MAHINLFSCSCSQLFWASSAYVYSLTNFQKTILYFVLWYYLFIWILDSHTVCHTLQHHMKITSDSRRQCMLSFQQIHCLIVMHPNELSLLVVWNPTTHFFFPTASSAHTSTLFPRFPRSASVMKPHSVLNFTMHLTATQTINKQ